MSDTDALLELRNASKRYANGTLANDDVNLAIHAGEIHAIVGENGAGKSTVMKLLYGMEQPSSGELRLSGQPLKLTGPAAAIALGIGLVPQHPQLLPTFTVAENVVLGAEPMRGGRVDRAAAVAQVRALSQRFGLPVDPHVRVAGLPVGMQQRVEILKALYRGARIMLLDEPSAVLAEQETQALFSALRGMVAQGLTVVLISHKLREIRSVADRFTVLRRGRVSGSGLMRETTEAVLGEMIVGKSPPPPMRAQAQVGVHARVAVRDLQACHADGRQALRVSAFDIAPGEILGIAGVEGNGQDVLARVVLGLQPATGGEGRLDGRRFTGLNVRAARRAGVAAIAEDRLHDGVAMGMSLADNAIANVYHRAPYSRLGWLNIAAIADAAAELIKRCAVTAPSVETPIDALSGGNMQKVVLGRETAASPRLLIASHPTRGVDIGAARALQRQLLELCQQGTAILLISADLDELLLLSDRVAVMAGGELVGHFAAAGLGADALGPYMTGMRRDAGASARLDSPFSESS